MSHGLPSPPPKPVALRFQIAAISKQAQLIIGPSLVAGSPCFSRTAVSQHARPLHSEPWSGQHRQVYSVGGAGDVFQSDLLETLAVRSKKRSHRSRVSCAKAGRLLERAAIPIIERLFRATSVEPRPPHRSGVRRKSIEVRWCAPQALQYQPPGAAAR